MRVRDLIEDPQLHLTLATPSTPEQLSSPVATAIATESIMPGPYLDPQTLLLTTGMALNVDDPRIWHAYVERLVDAGVVAIAFGIGMAHRLVPAGLTSAAIEAGMPVLVVPEDVPFLRLQMQVSRALSDERVRTRARSGELTQKLIELVSAGADVPTLLAHIAEVTGSHAEIIDDNGVAFEHATPTLHSPARRASGKETPIRLTPTLEAQPDCRVDIPVPIGAEATWVLRVGGSSAAEAMALAEPAVGVLGLALTQTLSRPPVGRSSAVARALSQPAQLTTEAFAQLCEKAEVSTNSAQVVRCYAPSHLRTRLLTRRVASHLQKSWTVVELEYANTILLLCSGTEPIAESTVHVALPRDGAGCLISPVSVHPGELALNVYRLAHHGAVTGTAMDGPVDIDSALVALPQIFKDGIKTAVLRPVTARRDTAVMLRALQALIETNSVNAAAAALGLHRNTMRAHKKTLEHRLGMNLDDQHDRATLALALLIYQEKP